MGPEPMMRTERMLEFLGMVCYGSTGEDGQKSRKCRGFGQGEKVKLSITDEVAIFGIGPAI